MTISKFITIQVADHPIILYPAKHTHLTAVMMNLIGAKSTYLLGTLSIIVLAPPIYMKRDSIMQIMQTSSLQYYCHV